MDSSQDGEPSRTRRVAGSKRSRKAVEELKLAGIDASISAVVGNIVTTSSDPTTSEGLKAELNRSIGSKRTQEEAGFDEREIDKRPMSVRLDHSRNEVTPPIDSADSLPITHQTLIANEENQVSSPNAVNSAHDDSGSLTADGSASETGMNINEDPINSKGKQKAEKIDWKNSSDEGSPKPLMDKELQEMDLVDSYDSLPILRPAQLQPFNKEETLPGFFKFKLWRRILFNGPETSERIKQAILFDIKGNTFNPAWANPSAVAVAALGPIGSRFIVSPSQTNSCMLALTTGCTKISELVHGRVNTFNAERNTISKRVCIIPHSQEFERFVGFVGMAFNIKEIKAHCFSDFTLTMSTRAASLEAPAPRVTNVKFQSFLSRHLNSGVKSPAVSRSGGNYTFVRTSLSPHDNVPVYDARKSDFTLQDDLADVTGLPLYEGGNRELPDGSCVTVAHTIGVFKNKDNEEVLTLNIHWAILWGVPNTSTF